MAAWVWIVIAAVIVVVIIGALLAYQQRSRRVRKQFGPEYDRTVEERGSRREAEAELRDRLERRQRFDIRPLAAEARERYGAEWREAQARFVDDPQGGIAEADRLVHQVMAERGYPMEDFEQRAADVSVDHPEVVNHYRAAHSVSVAAGHGEASTEDLRQAMVHYRALFEELLER
ncbi:MAG TPA: hypothetical protein VE975_06830 [Actinomycetota bacterium]|jgi:hypothetical protein|nr:hypothetical protein [Chloroflexota bacterium]HYY44889.1 hypothetical protein [Actinomycetota bacterium]